MLSTAIPANGL